MCKSPLHPFLAELPKCEHHIHLEGCLTPELVFKLAAKNNIALPSPDKDPAYKSPESLAKRYEHFENLEDFLQYHYRAMRVLVTQEDFEMLGWEYFKSSHADGVQHAEVFFDPQSHTSRGISFDAVVAGYKAACKRAEEELGVTSLLIMCFLRHLPAPAAAETLQAAIDGGYLDPKSDKGGTSDNGDRVIGALGLDSSEIGFPPELFKDQFLEAERRGVHRTAHGGEEGDPTYISGALDALHVERIDHGIRLTENPKLMRRVADEGILLTMCPLSNVRLQAVKDISQVPIKTFMEAGIKFSLNSDDPAYFGGYILNNFCAVQEAFGLTMKDWKKITENSIQCSWITKKRKSGLIFQLDECLRKYNTLG